MRRSNNFLPTSRVPAFLAALVMALVLPLAFAAGSASAADALVAERQKVIENILETTKGDPAALEAQIGNIFGDLQGDDAVARAQQILDALPADISDAQWAAVNKAIGEKASALSSQAAATAIGAQLAAKQIALGKGVQTAKAETSEKAAAPKRQAPTPAPPQDEVICASATCD